MDMKQSVEQHKVMISTMDVELEANLALPDDPLGLVLFAHGSGSSRKSPRNRFVANVLNEGRLGTLLMDLLTSDEHQVDQRTRELRFDMELLSERLTGAVDWVCEELELTKQPLGLFGASTGAAAALMTAAQRPERISSVVSRGGRPDLANHALPQVHAPTLLIVGGRDPQVLELNQRAAQSLHCEHQLEVVEGASHLFEEEGKLAEVAQLAQQWFRHELEAQQQQ